jgi:hypothetical protein
MMGLVTNPMSEDERQQLAGLLYRYAETEQAERLLRTARFADVSGIEQAASRKDVQRVIAQMREALPRAGHGSGRTRRWTAFWKPSKLSCIVSQTA